MRVAVDPSFRRALPASLVFVCPPRWLAVDMHFADVMWVLLKLVLVPVLLAACFLISMLGRQAARLWLPVVFALQSMVLSSQTACLLFTLTYAVNSGWARDLAFSDVVSR
jgi:hypothetical protein